METLSSSHSLFLNSINERTLKLFLVCLLLMLLGNALFTLKGERFRKKINGFVVKPSFFYNFGNITLPPKGFLVWNENCRIPRLEVFSHKIIENYSPYKTAKCTEKEPFVIKIYESILDQYRLKINTKNEKLSSYNCCYKEIKLLGKSLNYGVSPCLRFNQDFLVPKHLKYGIIVNCYRLYSSMPFFQDVFFFFNKIENNFKHNTTANVSNNLSILLIGIDGLSQFNFRRTMPQTFAYLRRSGWFELSGYNTIDYNTFPNLMALLSGLNNTGIDQHCQGYNNGYLDDCHLLFEKFRKYGYLTAYAEDETYMSTFHFQKKVFRESPTDFYMQPLMQLFEKEVKKNSSNICIGEKIAASLVFGALEEFIMHNKNHAKFGLFWTKSFSHYNFAGPSLYDEHMLNYMKKWELYGFFQNNVFIFFSDHGMRLGKLRNYTESYYEEQLPSMFIWLPPNICEKYPNFVYALNVNKHRLTSPYDIYVTLQHLLSLKNLQNGISTISINTAEACSTCQSVLKLIQENRSCWDAGISPHWCTCQSYTSLNSPFNLELFFNIVKLVVQKMNNFLAERQSFLCRKLKLKSILDIKLKDFDNKTMDFEKFDFKAYDPDNKGILLRAVFVTVPRDIEYKATFVYFQSSHKIILNIHDISVMSLYKSFSSCVNDALAEKFCICFES